MPVGPYALPSSACHKGYTALEASTEIMISLRREAMWCVNKAESEHPLETFVGVNGPRNRKSGERASAGFRRSCFSEGERRASIRMRRSLGLSVRETGRAESEHPLGFVGPALAKESGERTSV